MQNKLQLWTITLRDGEGRKASATILIFDEDAPALAKSLNFNRARINTEKRRIYDGGPCMASCEMLWHLYEILAKFEKFAGDHGELPYNEFQKSLSKPMAHEKYPYKD